MVGRTGPNIFLFDAKGKLRARLIVDREAPYIALANPKGKPVWKAP